MHHRVPEKKAFADGNGMSEGDNTLRVYKVDDSFIFEDVDFLNAWNGIDPQPLQSALQPLVIRCGGLVHGFLFSVLQGSNFKTPDTFSRKESRPENSFTKTTTRMVT
jgi:hypothetical protein